MALNAFTNVFRIAELRGRLRFTLGILAVYRLGIFISTPGIDRSAMVAYMESQRQAGVDRHRVKPGRETPGRRQYPRETF